MKSPSPYKFLITLLRHNLHIINCIHLTYTIHWVLINVYSSETTTTIKVQIILILPKWYLVCLCSPILPSLLASGNYQSVLCHYPLVCIFSNVIYIVWYNTYPFVSSFFHSVWFWDWSMLCVSIAHSFVFHFNPLYGYTASVYPFFCWWIFDLLLVWWFLWIKLLWIFLYVFLWLYIFISLGSC